MILLTSYHSTNLDSAYQEMEVVTEGAAINCFCLTQFGKPSPATVNLAAPSSPIGGVRLTQQISNLRWRRQQMPFRLVRVLQRHKRGKVLLVFTQNSRELAVGFECLNV